jgi:SRSO17 transposase
MLRESDAGGGGIEANQCNTLSQQGLRYVSQKQRQTAAALPKIDPGPAALGG